MLSRLSIDNYALIEKSVIDFPEGFTVITGETGAGKSIMLDALGLLMGARADIKAMGDKTRKTTVESIFLSPDPGLKEIFEQYGIDWDENELILRRDIAPSGKSRGFVNDTPVTLNVLGEISNNLLDIHSQHSNSLLNKPEEQLAIIDSFGKTGPLLEKYKEVFKNYVSLRNKIKAIKENIEKGKENREFIQFRLEQLDKIKPKRGELSVLEREFEILGDADRIKTGLEEVNQLIEGRGDSVLRQLQDVSQVLDSFDLDLFDPDNKDNLRERLANIKVELRDIADTMEAYSEKITSDPERLEKVQARIELLEETMKRFKVKDEESLVALHEQLRQELADITEDKNDLPKLESKLKELAHTLKESANTLTQERTKASEELAALIENTIRPLGMPNIKFKVELEKGKMSPTGQDEVIFMCSFNKNHPMQPISKIASGGEISRVMLGIKYVMAKNMSLPTIIFDEIDTGVSGEIAHRMGQLMREMSESMQVMAVTHLPQVAANGDTHLKVYKDDQKEKTVSHIKLLDAEERVKEIAGMLSGTTINEIALENARMLLKK